jgi:hypothetical protein|tara:strand:- start:58 stop:1248 length:1191 start_codon:yes stop_codon:yes gene_type:complete
MTTLTLDLEDALSEKSQTLVLHGEGLQTIRISIESSAPLEHLKTMDGPLCNVIFYAMRHCKTLKVCGPISEKLFRNIILFQEAWHCHSPEIYQPVVIEPTEVIKSENFPMSSFNNNLIQTFSGGVDSIFTLYRNHKLKKSEPFVMNRSALLVHGFDVPSSNQTDFDILRKRIEKITDQAGVELKVLRTSLRDNLTTNWNHSHGAALASALHLHAGTSRLGKIASSDPYNFVSFVPHAWGSSPATDYLLSGDEMEIIHDGAGYSRPQKLAYLAEETPEALSLAQFCWQGKDRATNCGTCDKCVQTRLALLSAGLDEAICFTTKFNPAMINCLKFSEETLGDLLPILDLAAANGINAPWVEAMREQIRPFLPVMYKSNRSIGRSLRYFKAALRELRPN